MSALHAGTGSGRYRLKMSKRARKVVHDMAGQSEEHSDAVQTLRSYDDTPSHIDFERAIRHRNWYSVLTLLKTGAQEPVLRGGISLSSLLHVLAEEYPTRHFKDCQAQIIKFMVNQAVDLDHADKTGASAVQQAAMRHNWFMVERLLEGGATATGWDPQGYTLLHRLATASCSDVGTLKRLPPPVIQRMTRRLVGAGIDPNVRVKPADHATPSSPTTTLSPTSRVEPACNTAASSTHSPSPSRRGSDPSCHLDSAHDSVEPACNTAAPSTHSPSPSRRDSDPSCHLDSAHDFALLSSRSPSSLPGFHRHAGELKGQCKLKEELEDGETPLHMAVRMRDWTMVHALLVHGADPGLLSVNLFHLLASDYRAVDKPSTDLLLRIITQLKSAGVDIQAVNAAGRCPLALSLLTDERSPGPVCLFLLAGGAQLHCRAISNAMLQRLVSTFPGIFEGLRGLIHLPDIIRHLREGCAGDRPQFLESLLTDALKKALEVVNYPMVLLLLEAGAVWSQAAGSSFLLTLRDMESRPSRFSDRRLSEGFQEVMVRWLFSPCRDRLYPGIPTTTGFQIRWLSLLHLFVGMIAGRVAGRVKVDSYWVKRLDVDDIVSMLERLIAPGLDLWEMLGHHTLLRTRLGLCWLAVTHCVELCTIVALSHQSLLILLGLDPLVMAGSRSLLRTLVGQCWPNGDSGSVLLPVLRCLLRAGVSTHQPALTLKGYSARPDRGDQTLPVCRFRRWQMHMPCHHTVLGYSAQPDHIHHKLFVCRKRRWQRYTPCHHTQDSTMGVQSQLSCIYIPTTIDPVLTPSPLTVTHNPEVVEVLIASGACSRGEVWRWKEQLEERVRETDSRQGHRLLAVVRRHACAVPSLQSLARLALSHAIGCGPRRQMFLQRADLPGLVKGYVQFDDLFETGSKVTQV